MNLDDLSAKVGKLATAIRGQVATEMELVATTATSRMITRVSETGKDEKGSPFKPYTPIYEQFKRGAVGTVSFRQRKDGKKARANRRTKQATPDSPVGRFRGIVDFTLTGQMLSSIGIIESGFVGNGYRVVVGGRDQVTKEKMAGNAQHRPGWTNLSKEEKDDIRAQSKERMTRWAEAFLNS